MPEKVSGTGRCARRARIAVGGADRASSRRVGPSPGVPARASRRRRSGRRAAGAGVVAAPEVPVARRAACAGVVAVSEAPVRSPSSRPRRGRRSPSSGVVGHHVPLGCVSRSPAEGAANPRARRGTGTCTWTLTAPGAGKPPPAPRTGRRCGTSPCWARRSSTTQRRTAREHGRLPPSTGRARSRGGHPLERRAGATCSPPTQPLRACRPAPCPCRRGRARRAPPGSNSPAGSARRSWPGRPAEGAAGPRPLAVAARRTGSTGRGGSAPGSHPTAALILATTISTATRL